MSQCRAIFSDDVEAELSIYVPRWSWLYLGLIDQPVVARVQVYQIRKQGWRQRMMGPSGHSTILKRRAVKGNITIHTTTWQSRSTGHYLLDNGTKRCVDASQCTKFVHRFWLWQPPWTAGYNTKGIGFNVLVQRDTESVSLQCHFGDKQYLPETHVSK